MGLNFYTLEEWLSDALMQKIAQENNLSETAFFVQDRGGFYIRWFTPVQEVDLCGHATLASAYVIFEIMRFSKDVIRFHSKSGELKVIKKGKFIELDFPKSEIHPCDVTEEITQALGQKPVEAWCSNDLIAIYEKQSDIVSMMPDFSLISQLACRGVIITAPGDNTDFVSRFFAPAVGINEDPVTGSAHCALVPYWANRLGKKQLSAAQLSQRGGKLQCEMAGEHVLIAGRAVKYLEGTIEI